MSKVDDVPIIPLREDRESSISLEKSDAQYKFKKTNMGWFQ